MKTCPKCGILLIPKRDKKKVVLFCRKCGGTYNLEKDITIESKVKTETESVVVITKREKDKNLPVTKVICPKCGNEESYYYLQQTRGADEPPTVFYTCTKCGYSWRSFE